ncbi:TPA: AAA family ATPase [Pseudomonas aeruginosa]|uniref:KAP family P-loop NTPase fold protein n=2 Tax=Gammaproteobacteria TaxID=1236 RepID=UPI000F52E5EF|nr:P-loop NTPase fold protein [Pseudomonas aeruginosa]MCO2383646.1 NTPase [Pseudomonas aeruginosa]RPX71431.1 NTPase [Pseudomonas aeruginosa]RUJ18873.1 NTPase [Pseudomonas aeruginosa]HBO3113720.1 AAA family ATPase [Pseudomonas aeruginosa]HCF1994542.1 AAA family ATPase [Pseudomonas aeruginosa]
MALSSDRPSIDPVHDLFGHAPFAKGLAESIAGYPGDDGIVMALYGPWGAGKSTVLSYVRYYIEQTPERSQPVIVPFNPWWFSGQENLARAFLGQLQAVLPSKSEKFKKLGSLLGDFAENVGGLIDLSGVTGGAASKIGKLLGRLSKQQPKDVPALKAQIADVLREAGKRILVVVDDIDRLAPDETRQLFTVIKGLADFPNVAYLLAFDREVAAQAIEQQSGLPGERYLEKIIQVPFELPPVDRSALRAAFFQRLGEVLGELPEGLFDHGYWTNMFNDGIDDLIVVPRDMVRFTNTLAVTYPAVRGEVNPVDFIALEAVRVFLPNLYRVIRGNPEKFVGYNRDGFNGSDRAVTEAFHQCWLNDVPETLRDSTQALIHRMFPKTGQMGYGADWLPQWRRALRACHPDLFPTYFRLSVPPGAIRREEVQALLGLAQQPEMLGQALVQAASVLRPDGLSKARALLERLMDHVEEDVPPENISVFICVLLDVGDELVLASDERGAFDFGNESRVTRLVYHLLKRVPKEGRLAILNASLADGRGIGVQRYLLAALLDELSKEVQGGDEALLDAASLETLKAIWVRRVQSLAIERRDELVQHVKLDRVLWAWREWGDPAEVRGWCEQVTITDEGLLAFIPHFCSHSRTQVFGESAVKIQPRLNPTWLENYVDTAACARRLGELTLAGRVPSVAQEAVDQYLREFEMLSRGQNPEGIGAFD